MAVDGNDRVAVAVIQRSVQYGLQVRKYRIGELEGIGQRMKIRYRGVANPSEIEHKVIAGGKAAQGLVRRSCDDSATRRKARILHGHRGHSLARIMHDHGTYTLTGVGRVVDDSAARTAHTADLIPIIHEIEAAAG